METYRASYRHTGKSTHSLVAINAYNIDKPHHPEHKCIAVMLNILLFHRPTEVEPVTMITKAHFFSFAIDVSIVFIRYTIS